MVKTTDKTTKKFTSRMQANLLLVFCIVTLMLIGLMGRLIYLLQTKGDTYAKQVLSRETYVSSVLPYKRGDILDRNGTVLARSELQYKLIIDPMRLNDNPDCITSNDCGPGSELWSRGREDKSNIGRKSKLSLFHCEKKYTV